MYSTWEFILDVADDDLIRCYDKDGTFRCAGNWFHDKVLSFIDNTFSARYVVNKDDLGYIVRRVK